MFKWENDTKLWIYSETLEPFSQFQLRNYIENISDDIFSAKQLRLMIEDKELKQVVGIIDIFNFDAFHSRAGIGILIDEKFRRQNYASEALELVTNYCFNYLKLHSLYCEILAHNTSSIQLFENAGFTPSGTLKDWRSCSNGFCDVVMYQRVRE
ncbi:MAG: GNAT family N-acetyltransferase [Bacteroidales bacterium]|nr:GNAT family N-acetyltransferase [Bacteroidales bacterium]